LLAAYADALTVSRLRQLAHFVGERAVHSLLQLQKHVCTPKLAVPKGKT